MKATVIYLFCVIFFVFLTLSACSKAGDSAPVKVIFDTDMGSDCDDAGALALLHHYTDRNKAEIIACIYSSGKVPYGAGIIEAINIRCGRPDIPVGACHDDDFGDPQDKMSAEKLARDTSAFGNSIVHNRDAVEQTRLCRRLLAAEADSSTTYITVGHTRGLYELLVSQPDSLSPLSGRELVARKVRRWVALGALGSDNEERHYVKDWNFFFNESAFFTDYLVKHYPGEVVFIDAGSDVLTGSSLKDTEPGNIVRTVYRDWLWNVFGQTLDDQRPSWDLAAVFFAIRGTGDFLYRAAEGWLEFDPEKGCRWRTGPNPYRHTLIKQKIELGAAFAELLNKRIALALLDLKK